MRQHLAAVVFLSTLSIGAAAPAESSWIFQPSTYSHDPQSGQRVTQYAAKAPAYAPDDPTYQRSGYIHNRTSLRGVAGSIDRRHYVETWGAGEAIRPYGEWEFPFRAGATPFGPWGNPSGPWTMPFDSWVNPYGLGKLYNPYWYQNPWYPGPVDPGAGGTEPGPHDRPWGPGQGGYPGGHSGGQAGGYPSGSSGGPHGGGSDAGWGDPGGRPEGVSQPGPRATRSGPPPAAD